MNIRKYEDNIRARHMKPVKKFKYKDCIVLISDGFQRKSPMFPEPHYKTEWAFGRSDEKLDVAQPLNFAFLTDENGFQYKQKERIALAEVEARKFIDNCEKIDRYGK